MRQTGVSNSMRYFIAFLATIGLIILLIILLFHGSGKPKPVPATQKTLVSYATTDASVSLTIQGPVSANQDYNEARIIVSNSDATFEHIQGYQGNVVKRQDYANNIDAYTNFLFALQRAGFTNGNKSSSLADYRGYCPLGNRYIFNIQQDGQTLQQFWATNCGTVPQTYLGNLSLTLQLFQNQIPDYGSLIETVNL